MLRANERVIEIPRKLFENGARYDQLSFTSFVDTHYETNDGRNQSVLIFGMGRIGKFPHGSHDDSSLINVPSPLNYPPSAAYDNNIVNPCVRV